MSDDRKTPGGHDFEFYEWEGSPTDGPLVVLLVYGAYSDVSWTAQCVAGTIEDAMAWIDAHPLRRNRPHGFNENGCYEVQRVERAPVSGDR